jgi:transcriptional repressor NrdR
VVDSRVSDDGDSIRRRRRCLGCEKRFTTFETADVRMPQVVKSGGHRAEFDVERVRTSFMRALHKRPVPTPLVDEAIGALTNELLSLGEREVPARRVGEMDARERPTRCLRPLASVYKSFQDTPSSATHQGNQARLSVFASLHRMELPLSIFTADDHHYMQQALRLAGSTRRAQSPRRLRLVGTAVAGEGGTLAAGPRRDPCPECRR